MCHSQIELERYFTGDLPEVDAERVRSHIDGCAECKAALSELEGDKIRFLNVYPFEDFAKMARVATDRSIAHRVAEFFRTPWSMQLYGGVAAITALLILMIPVYFAPEPEDAALVTADGIGYEGGAATEADSAFAAQLSFIYMRDGEMRQGGADYVHEENDKLQFRYSYGARHYAALISVDDFGTLTFYMGGDGIISMPAGPGNGLIFPVSARLYGAQGEELVVALISETEITGDEVSSWVRGLSDGNYRDLGNIEKSIKNRQLNDRTVALTQRIVSG